MDKGEMIENIADYIQIASDLYRIECIKVAKYLVENKNCRIIADDEIVVKKSEYEKKLNEYYGQGRASAFGDIEEQKDVRVLTKEEFYNLKPTLIYDIEAIDKTKQEATREILQELKEMFGTSREFIWIGAGMGSIGDHISDRIEQFAKDKGIELE